MKKVHLAVHFEIQSIPTLMVFKDGLPVERLMGVQAETKTTSNPSFTYRLRKQRFRRNQQKNKNITTI